MIQECFICNTDITDLSDDQKAVHQKHGLTEVEYQIAWAVEVASFCDHFCCGLEPKVCYAKALTAHLHDEGLLT